MNVLDVIHSIKTKDKKVVRAGNVDVTVDIITDIGLSFIIYHDRMEILDDLTERVIMSLNKQEIDTIVEMASTARQPLVDTGIPKTSSINGEKFVFTVKKPKFSSNIEVTVGDDDNRVMLNPAIIKELPTIMKILRNLRKKLLT